jgi:hypothetical protein
MVRQVLGSADPSVFPRLAALASEVAEGREGGGEFADGLGAVVDGLLGWGA